MSTEGGGVVILYWIATVLWWAAVAWGAVAWAAIAIKLGLQAF